VRWVWMFVVSTMVVRWLLIFVNDCTDEGWSLLRVIDLDERMLMVESILTEFTEVKVIAHDTLVSHTNDWAYTTSITSNISMSDKLGLRMQISQDFTDLLALN
jgi:phosphopantetheine adenylyltransferase